MAAYGVTTPEDEKKALKKGYGVPMAWEQPSMPVTTAAALAPPAPPPPPPTPMSPELLAQLSDPRIAPRDAPGAMGGAATLPVMPGRLPAGVQPSTAGAGRGSAASYGVPNPTAVAGAGPSTPPPAAPPVAPPTTTNPTDTRLAQASAGTTLDTGEGTVTKLQDAQGRTTYTNVPGTTQQSMRAGVPSAANIGAVDAIIGRQKSEAMGTMLAQQQAEANSPRALALEQIKSIRDRNQPLTARGIQTLTDLNTADNTARDSAQRNANEARRVASGEAEAAQRIGVGRDLQATTKELAALQAKFAASTDPKERERLREEILLRQGKDKNEPNRFTVVPGGSAVDPATGQVVREPSRVLDNQTGRFVEQGAAAAAPKYETGKVYQDAQGRKAKWDGSKFVPA
jgi:hypothetical protein